MKYIFKLQTQSTYAASNISEASTRPSAEPETISNISSLVRRPSMEKSKMRLHLEPVVPPPPPPRTVTLLKPPSSNHSGISINFLSSFGIKIENEDD